VAHLAGGCARPAFSPGSAEEADGGEDTGAEPGEVMPAGLGPESTLEQLAARWGGDLRWAAAPPELRRRLFEARIAALREAAAEQAAAAEAGFRCVRRPRVDGNGRPLVVRGGVEACTCLTRADLRPAGFQ
jgi:hypothetical protein